MLYVIYIKGTLIPDFESYLYYPIYRGDEKSWFQAGNEKTATLDKTLDPVWNTTFQFEVIIY